MKAQKFDWDKNNCVEHWLSGAIAAMTGVDIAHEYRGKYVGKKGGLKMMKDAKVKNLADLLATHLPEITLSQVTLGDIAARPSDDAFGFSFGIVNGENALFPGHEAMQVDPLTTSTRFFRVG